MDIGSAAFRPNTPLSPLPMKPESHNHTVKFNRTERPTPQFRGSLAPHGELDALKKENLELKTRVKDLAREYQLPTMSHQEVVKLKDRIIQQERIIAGFRLLSEKQQHGDNEDAKAVGSLRRTLKERERVIEELSKIIEGLQFSSNSMTRTSSNHELMDRIKVLGIENDRLGQMVERLSRGSTQSDLHPELIEIKTQNEKLKLQMALLKVEHHSSEVKGYEHRIYAQGKEIECLQEKNRLLEQENQALMKVLKEQSTNHQKRRLEEQISHLNEQLKLYRERTDNSEALVKANQTLKRFQQTVSEEVGRELKRYEQKFQMIKQKLDWIERISAERRQNKVSEFESPIVSRFNPAETNQKLLTLTSFEETRGVTKEISFQQIAVKAVSQGNHTELTRINSQLMRLEGIVETLQQQLESKNVLCANQQRLFDELSRQLQEYREKSLRAIDSQFETERVTREKELDEARKLHRFELDSLRVSLENELIDVVNANTEKVDLLRNKIHQQNLDLLKLQGENDRLKSQLRMARTDQPVLLETKGFLQLTAGSNKLPALDLKLQHANEVVSQSDSRPESKFLGQAGLYADSLNNPQRWQLKQSMDRFKQVIDNLIVENGMIPELKSRIQVLQSELLRLEQNVGQVDRRVTLLEN